MLESSVERQLELKTIDSAPTSDSPSRPQTAFLSRLNTGRNRLLLTSLVGLWALAGSTVYAQESDESIIASQNPEVSADFKQPTPPQVLVDDPIFRRFIQGYGFEPQTTKPDSQP